MVPNNNNNNKLVEITCSAPGKLILFGEHAVVYGKNAIATSLSDLRTTIKVTGILPSPNTTDSTNTTTTDSTTDTIINFYAPSIGFNIPLKLSYQSVLSLFTPKQLEQLNETKYKSFVDFLNHLSTTQQQQQSTTNTTTTTNQDDYFLDHHLYLNDKQIVDSLVQFTKQLIQQYEIESNVAAIEYNKIISVVSVLYLCLIYYHPNTNTANNTNNNGSIVKFDEINIDLSSSNGNTSLPIGAGLGSSAAFSVCLVSALLMLFNQIKPTSTTNTTTDSTTTSTDSTTSTNDSNTINNINVLKYVNEWAYFIESLIHGTPSGIDNSVSTFGGVISFSKGKIQEFLSPQILPKNMRILIVNTRHERNTKLIVQGVRERREQDFENYEKLLNEIQQISNEYLNLLKNNNNSTGNGNGGNGNEFRCKMEELIDRNHLLLNEIGTGHEKLDLICLVVAKKYNLHGKLTGAGGGGCAFILLNDSDGGEQDEVNMKLELESHGFQCFMSNQVAGMGVQCDSYFTSNY